MNCTYIYRGTGVFVAVLFLLFSNGAVADEGNHEHPHSSNMDYSEYMGGDHHGMKGHHGEIRGHGKKKGYKDPHGHSKNYGHGKKRGHHGTHGDANHHVFSLFMLEKTLHLSNSQVDALRPVEADYKKAVIQKKADVRIAEIDLGLLIDSPNLDRGQLHTIVDLIGGLKAELMMARIDAFLNVKKELTAKQQEQISKMIHGHMMGHGHAGMGHGNGHHHHGKTGMGHGNGHHHHGKKGHHGSGGRSMGH